MGYKLEVNDPKLMKMFENMCKTHFPIDKIAEVFGVHKDTLKLWVYKTYHQEFPYVYQRFMQEGNFGLGASSLNLAAKNAQMNIWLRKQWLGERDPDKQSESNIVDVEDWTPLGEMLK